MIFLSAREAEQMLAAARPLSHKQCLSVLGAGLAGVPQILKGTHLFSAAAVGELASGPEVPRGVGDHPLLNGESVLVLRVRGKHVLTPSEFTGEQSHPGHPERGPRRWYGWVETERDTSEQIAAVDRWWAFSAETRREILERVDRYGSQPVVVTVGAIVAGTFCATDVRSAPSGAALELTRREQPWQAGFARHAYFPTARGAMWAWWSPQT